VAGGGRSAVQRARQQTPKPLQQVLKSRVRRHVRIMLVRARPSPMPAASMVNRMQRAVWLFRGAGGKGQPKPVEWGAVGGGGACPSFKKNYESVAAREGGGRRRGGVASRDRKLGIEQKKV